ncbi:MAG TPA: hypothetical protein ENF49_03240 [Candidatus Altiarchaeales archaeon]|nr:hypothetical protein [Candidatus Altiarchaeales archaeon]HEX55125.1 hypothetical protein [Candidatus Altiarchaeales archaeon]
MDKKISVGILIGICGMIILCLISGSCSSYFCCYCFDLICIETGYREVAKDGQKIAEMHTIQVVLEMYYQMHGHYPGINGKDSWKETKEILIKENLLAPRQIFYEPEYWVSENKKEYVLKVLLNTHLEELNKDVDGYPLGPDKVWCGKNGEKEREYCIYNTKIKEIIITKGDFKRNPYSINHIEIENDTLKLIISYSGGCREHEFNLIWNGAFLESYPPKIELFLSHDSKDDHCEAFLTKTLYFDLKSIKEKYQQLYGVDGEIIINFYDFKNNNHILRYEMKNTENEQTDNANFSIKAKKYSSTLTITNTGDMVLTNMKIIKLTGFTKEGGAMHEEIIKLIPKLEIGKSVNVSIPEISSCGFLPDQSHVLGFNPPPEKELDILSGKLMYSEGRIIVTCDQGIRKSMVFCEIKRKSDILEFFAFYILPPVLVISLIIGGSSLYNQNREKKMNLSLNGRKHYKLKKG